MASIDKVTNRVVDGNQKDEEESRGPCAVDNAEHQIGESDKCGEGEFVPCTSDLGAEMLAMMVELVVCFLPAGKRLAVSVSALPSSRSSASLAASPYSSSSNDTPYSAASAMRLSVSGEDSLRSHLLTAWRLTPSWAASAS